MRVLVSLLAAAWLASSCRTTRSKDNDSDLQSESGANPRVLSLCFATQGNGYNWATTVSWMSETLRIHLESAQKLAADGQGPVYFDLGCMSGSSSGSLVTNVYGALLHNRSLLKNRQHPELYSLDEAAKIADGLRWMALSADIPTFSYLNTVGQVVTEWVYNQTEKIAKRSEPIAAIWNRVLGKNPPQWWDGSYVRAEQVLVDFVAATRVAALVSNAIVQERDDWGRLIHFPYFQHRSDMPQNNPEAETVDKDLATRAHKVNEISEAFLRGQFGPGGYTLRYQNGVYPPAEGPLLETAEEKLPEGLCTLTMGVFAEPKQSIPTDKLNYKQLRPLVLCDASTISKILSLDSFAQAIQDPHSDATRFLFLAVKNRRASMALSLREPRMMRELLGETGDQTVEVESFFDPRDAAQRTAMRLVPVERRQLGVTGGYLDRRVNALLISFYHEYRLQQLTSKGYKVMGRLAIFGKPDKDRARKFDSVVIRELFSNSVAEAKANLDDWYSIQKSFCSQRVPALAARYGSQLSTTAVDWDIASKPAAYVGKSRLVAYRSANAARLQTAGAEAKWLFDPQLDIPEPIREGAVPCYE